MGGAHNTLLGKIKSLEDDWASEEAKERGQMIKRGGEETF